MKTNNEANTREKARQYAAGYVGEMEENGLFKRRVDLSAEHKQLLKSYGASKGIKTMSDIADDLIGRYLSAIESKGLKPGVKELDRALERDMGDISKTGFFLSDEKFNYVRSLPRQIRSTERLSLTTGFALLMEHARELGLVSQSN